MSMTGPTTDRTLDRVRALLQQAEHPNTGPEEAAAFTARAAQIMARHGIEAAIAAERGPVRDEPASTRLPMDQPYSREKAVLFASVCRACRCTPVHHVNGKVTEAVTVLGFKADLDRARMLFASLLIQAVRDLAATDVPHGVRSRGGNTVAAWRRAWMAGFAHEIGRRLIEIELATEREATGPGTALVLASRADRVQAAVREEFPMLSKARPRTFRRDGYGFGREAGRRADIGQSGLSGTGRAQLGRTAT